MLRSDSRSSISRSLALSLLAGAALTIAGCAEEETAQTSSTSVQPTNTAPAWLLTSAPESPVGVADAKKSAAEGDKVTIRGRIGGRTDPMGEDAPTFVMMDTTVPSCADMEEDHCPTPWDYCCESAESIAANNATVVLVDETGAMLEADLGGQGIEALDEVIVVGTVGPRPDPAVLTIKATAIHRVGG